MQGFRSPGALQRFVSIGELILKVIDALAANAEGDAEVEAVVRAEVRALCAAHPVYAA